MIINLASTHVLAAIELVMMVYTYCDSCALFSVPNDIQAYRLRMLTVFFFYMGSHALFLHIPKCILLFLCKLCSDSFRMQD